jgi:hypothetical protein
MKSTINILIVVSCLLILIGCNLGAPESTATPITTIVSSPSLISRPSSTFEITPSQTKSPATAANTPTTTNTLTPTATRERYLTPTIPIATLSILQTLDAHVTQNPDLGEFYEMMRECMIYACNADRLGLSPNGIWAAFFTVNEKYPDDGGLIITNLDEEKRWYIYNSDFTGYTLGGARSVRVEHWSLDGKYVYLSPQFEDSGGYDWFWVNVRKLIRFNLETGSWADTKMDLAFSFSPDDRYIAYRGIDGVHIYEIKTGNEQVFPVLSNNFDFGKFTWSPDGKRLIFVVSFEDLNNFQEKGFTSYLIDLRRDTIRAIFKNDLRYIYPVLWSEPNIVEFDSLFGGQQYILDLETNEIKPKSQSN